MEPSGVLNAELFDRDEGDYNGLANDLVYDVTSRKRLLRPVITTVCGNITDGTLRQRGLGRNARKWRKDIVESWASAYIFTISEAWAEFEREHAKRLLDEALRGEQALRARMSTPPISHDNPDNRLTCAIVGMERLHTLEGMGDTFEQSDDEPWVAFHEYVKAQPSFARIAHLRSVYDVASQVFVKEKHLDAYWLVIHPAWLLGVGAGVLDIMGEIPEGPPVP